MKWCGCNPVQEPFEFPITEENTSTNYQEELDLSKLQEYFPEVSSLCELKEKIICEFNQIIDKLRCGIQPDLEFLLQEISMIYIYE